MMSCRRGRDLRLEWSGSGATPHAENSGGGRACSSQNDAECGRSVHASNWVCGGQGLRIDSLSFLVMVTVGTRWSSPGSLTAWQTRPCRRSGEARDGSPSGTYLEIVVIAVPVRVYRVPPFVLQEQSRQRALNRLVPAYLSSSSPPPAPASTTR